MSAILAAGGDAQRVALITAGERFDRARHGGREHQHAAAIGRSFEDVFELFAKAHVEHLVRFVEHHDCKAGQVERAAFDMIAQAAGRADHDGGARLQRAAFGLRVHTADAGRDPRAGLFVQPVQFLADL